MWNVKTYFLWKKLNGICYKFYLTLYHLTKLKGNSADDKLIWHFMQIVALGK